MVFCYGLITCIYSCAKELFLLFYGTRKQNYLITATAILSTALLLPLGLLLVLLCLVFKFFLGTYLKVRSKGNFESFLGADTIAEDAKLTITYVYIVEHHGSYTDLFAYVKQACQNLHNSNYKFSSIVQKCCGLYYFIKNKVTVDDVISVTDEDCSSKDKLLNYLETNYFKDFDSGTKLWDVKVFKKPIGWDGNNKIYYPVVIRYNHCIADAVCLAAFQHKYLLNDVQQERFQNAMKKSKRSKEVLKESTFIGLCLDSIKMSCSYLPSNEKSTQHLAVFIEEETKYLQLIRKLSRQLQCTFTDIVLSACAASVLDFLKSRNSCPDEIFVGNTCRELSEDISAVCSADVLRNNMTLDLYKFPCMYNENLYVMFKTWSRILRLGKDTGNFQIAYIFENMMTYAPKFASEYIFLNVMDKGCTALTNIPGPDSGKIASCPVKDCFVFCNHFMGAKFGLMLHSYGGRLQGSLLSDKRVAITREDLQSILNNTFNKIDKLWEIANK